MAKSDSFFVRASVDSDTTNFNQVAIDMGAYVDALGKSVVRIHNAVIKWDSPLGVPTINIGATEVAGFQLTTQSQGALVGANDKSVIASGTLTVNNNSGNPNNATFMADVYDVSPQRWTNGYLIGVEQLYLGFDQTANMISGCDIVLECTVETLSSSAAMALALSQQ